jgi:hypothetical protein
MSQSPPSWFDKQNPNADSAELKARKAKLLEELPKLLSRQKDKDQGRAKSFYPYLLIRSVLGDRGDRPINVPFWESPDIWTAQGDPASTPATPPDHGGIVVAGQPNTVYAHVWNLGFAPLAGIRVEFYWFNPSAGIDGSHAHLIGMARCELSGRGMPGSHKLVKCPKAWVPVMENGGHECLVVRASGIGDPIGGNEWQPWQNRHVAQRNVTVVTAGAGMSKLIGSLNKTRLFGTRLQLIQIGPKEAELVRHVAAPKLRVAEVDTHVLGEINLAGEVLRVRTEHAVAGMLAPVHAMAAGGAPAQPSVQRPEAVRVIDPAAILRELHPERPAAAANHVADLMTAVRRLNDGARVHPGPSREEAQVLRLASYSGEQLVGGYTLIVTGGH